jgi:DNA replication protein DnaC
LLLLLLTVRSVRQISITGEPGVGKTALAIATGRYMWTRNFFDGVFFIPLDRLSEKVGSASALKVVSHDRFASRS